MDSLLKALEDAGEDVKGSLERFMQNEGLYVRCLKKFPAEAAKNSCLPAFESQNWEELEKAAHAMKGLAGNLGLNSLFVPYTELLGRLRNGEHEGLSPLLESIREREAILCDLIELS